MAKLSDRIALITGASRGIGAAVAQAFAREGALVILVARTTADLEAVDDKIQAEGGKAILVPCDLRQFDQIDQMAVAIAQQFGRLDILVGNAADLGVLAPLTHLTPDIWCDTLDLNLTANWRLLKAFDPLLRQSKAGRGIFVTAVQGVEDASPYWGAYGISKAALESLVRMYAVEIENTTSLRFNLIDPGEVQTALYKEAMPGVDLATIPLPETITDFFIDLASPEYLLNGQRITVPFAKKPSLVHAI